jgi:hypothetical protein
MSLASAPLIPRLRRVLLPFCHCRRFLAAGQPVARACQIMTQNKAAPTSNPNEPMIVGNSGPPLNVSASPMSVIGVAAINMGRDESVSPISALVTTFP